LFKRKGDKINRNKKSKIEKEKGKTPPSAGPFPAQTPSLSRAPAFPPSRPKRPIARASALPSPLPLPARPHPSAALTLALSRSLYLWQAGPACQHLPRARDWASDEITVGRHRPVVSPFTRSPARLAPCISVPLRQSSHPVTPCPSRPVVATVRHHPHRGKLAGAHHLSPPFPPRVLIKGPPELPLSPHQPRPLPLPFLELD
jgi:hypothetical protein